MTRYALLIAALLTAATLGACENAKEELGLTRSAPDEFAIVKRAPLEMPPEYTLRPPQPGMPRPQEQASAEQAREAVMGAQGQRAGTTKGEAALLNTIGASSDPQIRNVVDYEAATARDENEPVVKKLLNIGSEQQPPAKVVDPVGESERLKKNAAEGKSVSDGATPAIDD